MNCSSCLICLKKTDSSKNCSGDDVILERQLSVIYLINKLLEIPSELCVNYLANFGDPEQWISICSDCSSLVNEGRQLFNKISKLQQCHKKIGQQIKLKMKVKPEPEIEQMILGQPLIEVRQYLENLENLKDDEDENDSNEDDWQWISVESKFEEDYDPDSSKINQEIKINHQPKKRGGQKRKIQQEESDSDLDEGVELSGKVRQTPKRTAAAKARNYAEEKEEEETKLRLEPDDEEEDENYDTISLDFEQNSTDHSDLEFAPETEAPKQNSKTKINPKSELKLEPNGEGHFSKIQTSKPKRKRISSGYKRDQSDPNSSFAQVLKKHEELSEKLELVQENVEYSQEELDERERAKEACSIEYLSKLHRVVSFPCQICTLVFKSFRGWNRHWNGKQAFCRKSKEIQERKMEAAHLLVLEPVICEMCGVLFKFPKELENHIRMNHMDKETLRCKGCERIYEDFGGYTSHLHRQEIIEPSGLCVAHSVRCHTDKCAGKFIVRSSPEAMAIHQKIRHVIHKVYKCRVCNLTFPSLEEWRKHYFNKSDGCRYQEKQIKEPEVIESYGNQEKKRKNYPKTQVKCTLCGLEKKGHRLLEYHMRSVHCDQEALKCQGCSKLCITVSLYLRHYMDMLASDPSSSCVKSAVKCTHPTCKDHYRSSQTALDLHNKVYHEVRPEDAQAVRYNCRLCGKEFPRRSEMQLHMKSKHDSFELNYINCPIPSCSKTLPRNRLGKHMKAVHHGREQRNFICHLCGNGYYTDKSLKAHIKTHNPEPCNCNICGKIFKFPRMLTKHMMSHSDDPAIVAKYKAWNRCPKRERERAERRRQNKETDPSK